MFVIDYVFAKVVKTKELAPGLIHFGQEVHITSRCISHPRPDLTLILSSP